MFSSHVFQASTPYDRPVAAPVPAQPQKRESKPQPQPTPIHHQRNARKIMPEKVVKEKNMADKMSVSLADTFIHGPTAVVSFSTVKKKQV